MRILLIQPPVQDFYQTPIRTYPLGLTSLAGLLLEEGFDVAILDGHDPNLRRTIALPPSFRYIRKYYSIDNKSPFRLFTHYYHFGLTPTQIIKEVRRLKPHLVGISALFSPYSHIALDIARRVKTLNSSIITVMGGAHVWSMPEQVLASGAVDFIIRGEAEWSLLELCRQLSSFSPEADAIKAIPGIGFSKGTSCYIHPGYAIIEELDALPLPARNLVDSSRYVMDGQRYTMLLTSRGCPYSCGFCALPVTPCATHRIRSATAVLAEISHCRQHHDIHRFDIEDDNFTADRRHAAAILEGVQTMGDITLSAMNGLSACNLTPSLLASMHETGFTHLDLALVTNSKRSRQAVSRPGSLDQFDDILNQAGRHGFRTTVHIILGLPEDTTDNMLDTLFYLMTKPCLIGANIYYPVPGSILFVKHQDAIRFAAPAFWRSTLASCESYVGQRDAYMTIFYLARMINYVKHLLVRLGQQGINQPLRESVQALYDSMVPAAVKAEERAGEMFCSRRLTSEVLGIFMLHRFCLRGRIERVSLWRDSNGIQYRFTEEFCRTDILEKFLRRAAGVPLASAAG
jgi:anaerobic magnesium-protoporphyrin IX monomethyl ester cyclase